MIASGSTTDVSAGTPDPEYSTMSVHPILFTRPPFERVVLVDPSVLPARLVPGLGSTGVG